METRGAPVVLETTRHRIAGTLHLPRDGYRSRLTDYLNAVDHDFVALTEVEVTPLDGPDRPTRHPYLAVARRHVVIAHEAAEAPAAPA